MGKRGPRSSAPGGYGSVTAKGYRRIRHGGRLRMEHDVVWERERGPIPEGEQIHHVNGDKLDNRIANLRAVDARTHKRIHSGCTLEGGVWIKPCHVCGDRLPIDREHWYIGRSGDPLYGRCRRCHIRAVVRAKQERRSASRGERS